MMGKSYEGDEFVKLDEADKDIRKNKGTQWSETRLMVQKDSWFKMKYKKWRKVKCFKT